MGGTIESGAAQRIHARSEGADSRQNDAIGRSDQPMKREMIGVRFGDLHAARNGMISDAILMRLFVTPLMAETTTTT